MTESAVSLAPGRTGSWSLADLPALPEGRQRYEIIDGCLLVTPPPPARHQSIVLRLIRLLHKAAQDGMVPLDGVSVALRGGPTPRVLVPDLVVARPEAVRSGRTVFEPADLLLAVEIVAPSSESIDRLTKPSLYAEAGIDAFWRVEPDDPHGPIIVSHLLAAGAYRVEATVRGEQRRVINKPFTMRLCPAELVS